MATTIKGVLFDKDGTLVDFHRSWMPINTRAAAHAAGGDAELQVRLLAIAGLDFATGRYRSGSLLAAGTSAELAAAWIKAGSRFDATTLTRDLDAMFCAGVDKMVPVTDLRAFFGRLKARRLVLGVASNDSAAAVHGMLARFGCDHLVDFIAGYDSGHGSKPAPGMFDAFAAHANLPAAAIAMIGDNVHDLEMGFRGGAGMRIGVLTGTSARAELLPHADLCLESICDLETALFD